MIETAETAETACVNVSLLSLERFSGIVYKMRFSFQPENKIQIT
jgi:hypothetical protein